jgi:hypothetical protein
MSLSEILEAAFNCNIQYGSERQNNPQGMLFNLIK